MPVFGRSLKPSAFINGPQVKEFQENLKAYMGSKYVITCGNGTMHFK